MVHKVRAIVKVVFQQLFAVVNNKVSRQQATLPRIASRMAATSGLDPLSDQSSNPR